MASLPSFRTRWLPVLLAVLAGQAWADDRFGCEQPIRVGFNDNPVFQLEGQGIDPDLLAELGRRTGCRFETHVMRSGQIWPAIQQRTIDLTTSAMLSHQRRAQVYFVSYLFLRNKLIVPLSLGVNLHSLEGFRNRPGLRLGIVQGRLQGPYLDGMLQLFRGDGRLLEFHDDHAAFAALLDGQIDGLLGHELGLLHTIDAPLLRRRLRVVDVIPGPAAPRALAFSRQRFTAAQSAEWQRLIEEMLLDGSLARIMLRNAPLDVAAGLLDSGYRYGSTEQGWAQ
ncbi:MAG: hypothetical protein GAK45_00069 [Pseudomonas citronellolis]|nr:MAG: hypothetical protein GAK45_00069 [Pseudomonas citronellolis]